VSRRRPGAAGRPHPGTNEFAESHRHAADNIIFSVPLPKTGELQRGPDGKISNSQLGGWRTKEVANKFSQLAIAALLEKHPSALDGVEP